MSQNGQRRGEWGEDHRKILKVVYVFDESVLVYLTMEKIRNRREKRNDCRQLVCKRREAWTPFWLLLPVLYFHNVICISLEEQGHGSDVIIFEIRKYRFKKIQPWPC